MAATIATEVPSRIFAGDTLQFKISVEDYSPTAGWTLKYSFRKQGGDGTAVDLITTDSAGKHYVNESPLTTGTWLPGNYDGVGYVTNGTDTFTIWRGPLEILPNLSQAADTFDPRSRAKKILDYIDASWERVSKKGEYVSTSIEGVSLSFRNIKDMMDARNYWLSIYNAEQAVITGKGSRILKVEFVSP